MNIIIVLHRPQDVVNIAVVIRAMMNFGVRQLRLVDPEEFDPHRIQGIAHKSGDVVARAEVYETLPAALADCTHVVGLTARGRTVKRNVQRPVDLAEDLERLEATHRTALVFGPEDRGLTNQDLDLCHRIVTIPTAPDQPSLNLAQAATVVFYELFKTSRPDPPFKRPRRDAAPATHALLEQLFDDAERALTAIEFFKSHRSTSIMRTVREMVHRTPLDVREVQLTRAMLLEIVHFLERKGIAAP